MKQNRTKTASLFPSTSFAGDESLQSFCFAWLNSIFSVGFIAVISLCIFIRAACFSSTMGVATVVWCHVYLGLPHCFPNGICLFRLQCCFYHSWVLWQLAHWDGVLSAQATVAMSMTWLPRRLRRLLLWCSHTGVLGTRWMCGFVFRQCVCVSFHMCGYLCVVFVLVHAARLSCWADMVCEGILNS